MLLASTPGAGKRNTDAREGQRDETARGIKPRFKASSLSAQQLLRELQEGRRSVTRELQRLLQGSSFPGADRRFDGPIQ